MQEGNLPTQQVQQQANKQASRGEYFDETAPIETMGELYQKMFWGDRSPYIEIDKHLSTGYLKESEIMWVHDIGDVIRDLSLFNDNFGLDVSPWAGFFHRKINFISMVSKSRGGFAIKEAGTSRVHSDEQHMWDTGEDAQKEGILDKIGALVSGGGGRRRGGGRSWDTVLPRGHDSIYEPMDDSRYDRSW